MKAMKTLKLHLLAFVSVPALVPGAAYAQAEQSEEQARGAASTMFDEITVTARKKSSAERAQDVPIALTAVSGAQIEAMFAANLTDVGMTMPNVRLDDGGSFPGVSNFTVRGMGFNSTIASVEPTVGLFVDGIYIGANLGGLQDPYDTESVEVLRGPQGTLFGRNVTGGAVVMRSRRPDGEFGGVVRAGLGSGERRLIGGGVEGSLTPTLAGKIYAQYSHMTGDFDNQATGGKHGRDEEIFVRPILRWRPNSAFDIALIGEYGKTEGDGVNSRIIDNPTQLAYVRGGRAPVGGADKININFDGYTNVEWKQAVLDANWDVGPGTITSISGYRWVDYGSAGDTDGSQIELARAHNNMRQHQVSEELRYAGKALDDKLDFTIGAYYFKQRVEQYYHVIFFGASNQRSGGVLHHHTASIFAQGDYEFLPNAFFTAGGRYTWETKRAATGRTSECSVALVCTFTDEGSTKWKNFAPKLGLSWKPSPDVLLYTSWSKGFRSGGYNIRTTGARFNPANPTAPFESAGPFDQEIVRALEGGIKAEFWDRRAKVNIAVFHNKYTGLQRTVNSGLVNFIKNAAAATIDGVEFEANLLPFDNLALAASVGYLDARYDDYILPLNATTSVDLKGFPLVRAPKWSYSLSATHDLSLGSAGQLTSRASLSYNGKTPANDAANYFVPSWTLLDASLSWSPSADSGLKISIWGRNLTNKTYAVTGTYVGGLFTDLYQALPRRFGAEVAYKF